MKSFINKNALLEQFIVTVVIIQLSIYAARKLIGNDIALVKPLLKSSTIETRHLKTRIGSRTLSSNPSCKENVDACKKIKVHRGPSSLLTANYGDQSIKRKRTIAALHNLP